MSELTQGAIFSGRYRVVRCIAAGGMGSVYEVIHLETERRRALKVMHPQFLQSEDLRVRFKREAKVAAQIESDFIVDVFDAGIDEATQMPFLVMELLRGEELGKRLKRLGRLSPEETVTYLHQTALALDKTHRASIIHRDLKPDNLFLTEREDGPPRIKVLDFGIAKIVAESATAGATQTVGTPLYMSPEQFNPRVRLTGACDIYALGMVAYTLLVGSAYWSEEASGGNVFALAAVSMHGVREPASVRAMQLGAVLPPGFDVWFARVTALDPANRFASATEAIRAMAEALSVAAPGSSSVGSASSGEGFGAPRAAMPSLNAPAPASSTPSPPTPAQPIVAYSSAPIPAPTPVSVPSFTPPPSAQTTPGTAQLPPKSNAIAVAAVAITFGAIIVLGGGIYLVSKHRSATSAPPSPVASQGVGTAEMAPAVESPAPDAPSAAASAQPLDAPADIPSATPEPSSSVDAKAVSHTTPTASVVAKPSPPPAAPAPQKPKKKYTRE